jgi:hypothetical protein
LSFEQRLGKRDEYLIKQNKINEINAIIKEDDYFIQRILSPLFNFDGRMLNEALIHMSTPISIEGEDITILCTTYDEYKNIKLISYNGACGILWLSIFKFLMDKECSKSNFKEFIKGDCNTENINGQCNYYRVGLTILSKLCKLPEKASEDFNNIFENEEIFQANAQKKDIKDLYVSLKGIYEHDDIVKCIKNICSISSPNYETLSLCYNLIDKNEDISNIQSSFDGRVEELLKSIASGQTERTCKIKINPSGYIYANQIFRHFEYLNILNNFKKHQSDWNDNKCFKSVRPLFEIVSI